MVAISMLTGPNGLLNKSTEAKIQNDKGAIKDQVETEVMGSYDKRGKVDWGILEKNLKENVEGIKKDSIRATDGENEENGITFEVERNGREYTVEVEPNGKVTVTDKGEGAGGGSSSAEPSEEPSDGKTRSENPKPGETASSTTKDNYTDESNKKATIPKDFTVSEEDHEIDTGLVVIAPDESEFVWVPVEKAIAEDEDSGGSTKSMAVVDPTDGNNYRGILYDFKKTSSSVRSGCTTTAFTDSFEGYREPAYLTDKEYGDEKKGTAYNNEIVTLDGLKREYKAMIESVARYGGFYVGRYETSLTGSKVQSKKDQESMSAEKTSGNRWWGMYEKEKNYASDAGISSVGSSMIWGSQYDAMLNWILTGGEASEVTTNVPTHDKTTTGSTPTDVMNKIFDLGNNLEEWTLEALMSTSRVGRGGTYKKSYSPSYRSGTTSTGDNDDSGSRLALYIK